MLQRQHVTYALSYLYTRSFPEAMRKKGGMSGELNGDATRSIRPIGFPANHVDTSSGTNTRQTIFAIKPKKI